jgi:DHA2 family multidrug resistance protein
MMQYFMSQGADTATATQQATAAIAQIVQQQAMVMAINDCYYLLGLLILISGTALFWMKKARTGGNMAVE